MLAHPSQSDLSILIVAIQEEDIAPRIGGKNPLLALGIATSQFPLRVNPIRRQVDGVQKLVFRQFIRALRRELVPTRKGDTRRRRHIRLGLSRRGRLWRACLAMD